MAVLKNSPANKDRGKNSNLTVVDFTSNNVARVTNALLDLLEIAKAGQIDGFVIAARMTPGQDRPYIYGAGGSMINNMAEAVGAAAMLQKTLIDEM